MEELNRERDITARKIAHDLRNSITVAMFAAESLLRRAPEEERRNSVRKLSETVLRTLDRTACLIEDLLNVTAGEPPSPESEARSPMFFAKRP